MSKATEYYWANREVILAKRDNERTKRMVRSRALMRKYGITLERYEEMLIEQNGVCAICEQSETTTHHLSGIVRSLAVDHDHKTGRVRGLLCHRCNRVLGLFDEDTELHNRAVFYLDSDT